jgi:hypothetical protein
VEPFEILQMHFVAIVKDNYKRIKKFEYKLVPVAIIYFISYQNDNGWMELFVILQMHFIAIVEENEKKKSRKKSKNWDL